MAFSINRYGYLPALMGAVVIVILLFLTVSKLPNGQTVSGSSAHFYKDPQRSIAHIRLKLFYAVPRNRIDGIYQNWGDIIKLAAGDLVKFYTFQFRGLSNIKYDIYPEPFILENESIFYDTESTNKGNPEALKRIVLEIEKRVPEFLAKDSGEFQVIGIIYEGVGASGTDGAFILARSFLSDEQYRPFSSTLFSHEFGHTLGLPDEYKLDTNQPFTDDIMGGGRRRPIDVAHFDKPLLKDMGIIQ